MSCRTRKMPFPGCDCVVSVFLFGFSTAHIAELNSRGVTPDCNMACRSSLAPDLKSNFAF